MFKAIKENIKKHQWSIIQWVYFLLSPLFSFMMVELLNGHYNIFAYHPIRFFFNIVIYYAIYFLVLFITNRLFITIAISASFFSIYGIINTFVELFRGTPILPFDLYSIQTALNVAGEYRFDFDIMMIVVFILTLAWIIGYRYISKKEMVRLHFSFRGITAILSIVMIFGVYQLYFNTTILEDHDMSIQTWSQGAGYHENGVMLSFMDNVTYMIVEKPEAYESQNVEMTLLNTNQNDLMYKDEQYQEVKNIIVVMNESYSDLSVVGDFETNIDYLSYYHSLDNAIKGNAYSSIFGGGTANSEFEFLTSNSLSFLPSGSMAYQMFMRNGITSLVDVLKANGFYSTAIHTYYKSGWNREKVYDLMGFDQKFFIEDYPLSPEDMYRVYPSDVFAYQKVIEAYEQSAAEKNFIFCVTMQNHGGYYFDYENEVVIENTDNQYAGAEQYLTSLANSDQALEVLVDYFSNVDEPTVILEFGDHQPSVETEFYEYLYGKSLNELTLEETQKRYMTPYLLWANYDIEEKNMNMSLNYLSTLLLEVADIELPSFYQYMNDLYFTYPVINSVGVIDRYNQYYSLEDVKEDPYILSYQQVQYNNLFDLKNKNAVLYTGPDKSGTIGETEVAQTETLN